MRLPYLRSLPAALAVLCACASPETPVSNPILTKQDADNGVIHNGETDQPVMATFGNVKVYGSGYGSAVAFAPHGSRDFYLLTDRGPNIDFPGGNKAFPVPSYTPRIIKAHLAGNKLQVDGEILFRRADGTLLTGLPIGPGGCGSTGEQAFTLGGASAGFDAEGIDSEGLVVLDDGSFWVSDEYGPFLAHFGADGRQITRLSPCNGGLPTVYAKRRPNRGMEGLTQTPDGQWLVGMMQAPLENPSSSGIRNVSRLTRVLFKNLSTGATREYAYLLEDATLQGNSEILALSATRFLVIERDGNFLGGTPAAAFKRIYEFDITGATDISTLGALGATPIPGGKTLEQATVAQLLAAGVVPVTKRLAVDLLSLGYVHDKVEGLALGAGNMLFVSNDDDFGIFSPVVGTMSQKILPATGKVDNVQLLQIKLK